MKPQAGFSHCISLCRKEYRSLSTQVRPRRQPDADSSKLRSSHYVSKLLTRLPIVMGGGRATDAHIPSSNESQNAHFDSVPQIIEAGAGLKKISIYSSVSRQCNRLYLLYSSRFVPSILLPMPFTPKWTGPLEVGRIIQR